MRAVYRGEKRIGSLIYFPHQKKHWAAYGPQDRHFAFERKKDAIDWLLKCQDDPDLEIEMKNRGHR